ncbi:hypothetical protein AAFF_G00186160 [Aldrovandia affinis]|uniref:Uncharacterized protein n=1 Tax=Aldrovandia affinis TaxID=143900 RepID=A0AAD7SXL8_9TELE|nr:hypothetical protein AAFF_G00186160 [Aldrovandia affinis]
MCSFCVQAYCLRSLLGQPHRTHRVMTEAEEGERPRGKVKDSGAGRHHFCGRQDLCQNQSLPVHTAPLAPLEQD